MTEFDLRSMGQTMLYHLDTTPLQQALFKLEGYVIQEAMRLAKGNCEAAAEMLGINRTTLVEKRRRHGMSLKTKLPKRKEPR